MTELKFEPKKVFSPSGIIGLEEESAHYAATKGSAGSRGWQFRWIRRVLPPFAPRPLFGLVERLRRLS